MMRALLVITGKDLRQQLRNGTLLLFALLLPLGMATLFSTVMSQPGSGFHARYVVADEDGGPAATAFVAGLAEVVGADAAFDVSPIGSGDQARALVDAGRADAAFIIPAGFSSDVEAAGRRPLRSSAPPRPRSPLTWPGRSPAGTPPNFAASNSRWR